MPNFWDREIPLAIFALGKDLALLSSQLVAGELMARYSPRTLRRTGSIDRYRRMRQVFSRIVRED